MPAAAHHPLYTTLPARHRYGYLHHTACPSLPPACPHRLLPPERGLRLCHCLPVTWRDAALPHTALPLPCPLHSADTSLPYRTATRLPHRTPLPAGWPSTVVTHHTAPAAPFQPRLLQRAFLPPLPRMTSPLPVCTPPFRFARCLLPHRTTTLPPRPFNARHTIAELRLAPLWRQPFCPSPTCRLMRLPSFFPARSTCRSSRRAFSSRPSRQRYFRLINKRTNISLGQTLHLRMRRTAAWHEQDRRDCRPILFYSFLSLININVSCLSIKHRLSSPLLPSSSPTVDAS